MAPNVQLVHFLKKFHCVPDLTMISGQYGDFEIWCAQGDILPKLAPYGRKRAFCELFVEIELFSRFGDDLRRVGRI